MIPTICFINLLLLLIIIGVILVMLLSGRELDYMNKEPFMTTLTRLEGGNRKVHIIERIGVDYHNIGTELLNDIHGTIIPTIEKEKLGNIQEIVREIFIKWRKGMGRQPVTWQTLVDVLREVRLHNLADDIVSVLEALYS